MSKVEFGWKKEFETDDEWEHFRNQNPIPSESHERNKLKHKIFWPFFFTTLISAYILANPHFMQKAYELLPPPPMPTRKPTPQPSISLNNEGNKILLPNGTYINGKDTATTQSCLQFMNPEDCLYEQLSAKSTIEAEFTPTPGYTPVLISSPTP